MQAVYTKNAYLETGAAQFDVSPTGLVAYAPWRRICGGATLTDFWNMGIRLMATRNFACCLTGVLIGWFTSLHHLIRFEVKHFILINVIGAICLVLWLVTSRRRQPETMILSGALGWVVSATLAAALT